MSMTRALKIMLVILILGSISIPLVSCVSKSAPASEAPQVATVQRGDLTLDITAGGNLVLSKKEDLAFEVSGTEQEPLTVKEVKVKEGDSVTQGQVLVTLDTKALEEKVTTRQRAFDSAKLGLSNTELAVKSAEIDLQTAKDAEQNVRAAEIDLETATDSYRKITYPYTARTFVYDAPAAIVAIHEAEIQLEKVKTGLGKEPTSAEYGDIGSQLRLALDNLAQARQRLSLGIDPELFKPGEASSPLAVGTVWTLRAAQFAVEKAQMSLDKAKQSFQTGLDKANLALDKARVSLNQSKLSFETARQDLDKAKEDLKKATIVAPFTGFVTKVNVNGGDNVKMGMVAVQVADPTKFEADIMVGERDIFLVRERGTATVQIDAMPTVVLSANVTQISPTGTIQSGVVNYKVKVELVSLQSVGLSARQRQLSSRSGSGQPTRTPGSRTPLPSSGSGQLPQPGSVTQTPQLREGLSVTVSILVTERKNVLLVPNQAITRTGADIQVQVLKGGVTETRSITTGISNWQYTEVTEGLTEGEKVVVPKGTTTTTATTPRPGQQPPLMIPGIGGPRR